MNYLRKGQKGDGVTERKGENEKMRNWERVKGREGEEEKIRNWETGKLRNCELVRKCQKVEWSKSRKVRFVIRVTFRLMKYKLRLP